MFVRRLWPLLLLLSSPSVASVAPVSLETLRNPNAAAPLHAEPIDFSPTVEEVDNPLLRPIDFAIELMQLDLDILPEFGRLVGSNTITVKATADDVALITLDAVDMQITSVTTGSGTPLDYYYDGAVLGIVPPAALQVGEELTLRVGYETTPTRSFYVTGPDVTSPERMLAAYTYTQPLGSRFWYPCLDRPSAKAPLTISVAVRSGLQVLANGYLLEHTARGDGFDRFVYRMDEPVAPYLVSLAIGEYEVVSLGQYRGKPLTLWTPPAIRNQAHYDMDRTIAMMDVFTSFTGTDYPFGTYSQSVAQAWGS